jgi:peptidoglycan/xylan/chitin deacetylase (PgdA/CDA1 family)
MTNELILNFHGIGEPHVHASPYERRYWWDEESFHRILDAIHIADSSETPIVITFDDGNISDVCIALPALGQRNLKARFFICAGRVGLNGYLDAAAIRELLQAGMSIGSHGMNHRDWRELDPAELNKEIIEANRILEGMCGCEITEASVPFGSYDRRILAKLKSAGYRTVYTSDGGLAPRHSWLKPRNTLDRSWDPRHVIEELIARNTSVARVRRFLIGSYKRLR